MHSDEQLTAFEKAKERGRGSSAWIGPSVGLAYLKQVPERAELSEDGLTVEWRYAEDPSQGRSLPDDYTGVLGKFIVIRHAEQIPQFITKYGKLNLCEQHGRPWNHNSRVIDWTRPISLEQLKQPDCVPGIEPDSGAESVQEWLDLANQFRALLQLCTGVRDGDSNIFESPAWDVVNAWPVSADPENDGPDFKQARPTLANLINNFLEIGGVRLQVLWPGTKNEPDLAYPSGELGLFGVLALQLAMLVTRTDGIYECSGCCELYPRKARKPKPGQNNWCPICKADGVDHRNLMREMRANNPDTKGTAKP